MCDHHVNAFVSPRMHKYLARGCLLPSRGAWEVCVCGGGKIANEWRETAPGLYSG